MEPINTAMSSQLWAFFSIQGAILSTRATLHSYRLSGSFTDNVFFLFVLFATATSMESVRLYMDNEPRL